MGAAAASPLPHPRLTRTLLPWTAGARPRDHVLCGVAHPAGCQRLTETPRWVGEPQQEMSTAAKNSVGGVRKQTEPTWKCFLNCQEIRIVAVEAAATLQQTAVPSEIASWRNCGESALGRAGGSPPGRHDPQSSAPFSTQHVCAPLIFNCAEMQMFAGMTNGPGIPGTEGVRRTWKS